jgi:precorrin-3B C17-methyltransferase
MNLTVVGIGPGMEGVMTADAVSALQNSDVLVGYSGYIQYVKNLNPAAEIVQTGMTSEVERCKEAVKLALTGKRVCVVSSGDSGVYGMASLIYELAAAYPELDISVVPGLTAALAAAAILGAPISGDFACISLSDLLTPWELIERRLRGAALGDFIVCIYNPSSRNRAGHLKKACEILLESKSAETVCGIVKNAYRPGQEHCFLTLNELKDAETDMFTIVIIGNASTVLLNGKIVTSRGYK